MKFIRPRPLLALISPLALVQPAPTLAAPAADTTLKASPKPYARRVETRGAVDVRTDSDHTTVVAPRARVRVHASPRTQVDVTYAADAWTSASIDIRTAATSTVRELRNEGTAGVSHTRGNGRFGLSYRLSHEPDYLANGVSGGGELDVADRTVTLSLRLAGSYDVVGRAGDALFKTPLMSGGALLGAAFVLTRTTLLQLTYELRGALGYQASPYRFVGVGGDGSCTDPAAVCLPETHPDRRSRHALAARVRQAIGKYLSLGAGYRFYLDSWRLRSHTVAADLSAAPTNRTLLALEYRSYLQSGAYFYQARYLGPPSAGFITRDRELSSMFTHRLALAAHQRWALRRGGVEVGGRVGGTLLGYDQFVGLDRVKALELTLLFGGEF